MPASGFAKLWTATAMSKVGDGVTLSALPLLAATITRDPGLVAGVTVAGSLPWLLFPLLGGAIADRVDRRRLMAGVDAIRAGMLGIVAVAVLLDTATLPLLYLVVFVLGTCETLFDNAYQAILPAIVGRAGLERANARLQAAHIAGESFVGPPVGSLLFVIFAALPFIVDGVSFAAAAVMALALRGSFMSVREGPPTSVAADIAEGVRWLWGHRLLRALALLLGMMNFWSSATMSIFVLYALEVLHVSKGAYGLLAAAGALGAIAGSLTYGPLVRVTGTARVLIAMLVVYPLMFVVIGFTSNALVAAMAFAVEGLMSVLWNVATVSLRQKVVPDRLLGRVNSVYRLLGWGTLPLGAAAGGLIAREYGLRAPWLVGAVVQCGMAVLALRVVNTRTIAEVVDSG